MDHHEDPLLSDKPFHTEQTQVRFKIPGEESSIRLSLVKLQSLTASKLPSESLTQEAIMGKHQDDKTRQSLLNKGTQESGEFGIAAGRALK